MARSLSPQTAAKATQPKPNTINLSATIQDGFKKLLTIEDEIADLEAKHIDPLKEDRTELWRDLKKSTDLNRKDLALLYAIFKRDKEAANLDEESERDKVRNGLRAAYEALQEGQMLSFLAVVDGANGEGIGADKTEQAKEALSLKEARTAGRQAGQAGKQRATNPHAKGSDSHQAWDAGWIEGQNELGEGLGLGKTAAGRA